MIVVGCRLTVGKPRRLCTGCLHEHSTRATACPACGDHQLAKLSRTGHVISLPAAAGMPCQGCFSSDQDLALRYYRRVVGLLIFDRVHVTAGYFCSACRSRHLAKHLVLTLLLGWWGVIALYFRNPYAIVTNLWALFAAPLGAGRLGAMHVAEIRAQAAQEQRVADAYTSMPSWLENIDEADLALILSDRDYYATLGVEPSAGQDGIKAAWRDQVKRHHPDAAGAGSHEQMVAINDAYKVLGDRRLRDAYDHQDELLEFFDRVHHAEGDAPADMTGYDHGCALCGLAFGGFDEFAGHIDDDHPDTDYVDALVELRDGEPIGHDGAAPPQVWRCRACPALFDDYDGALAHADAAHPDRVVVDARQAVEPA